MRFHRRARTAREPAAEAPRNPALGGCPLHPRLLGTCGACQRVAQARLAAQNKIVYVAAPVRFIGPANTRESWRSDLPTL